MENVFVEKFADIKILKYEVPGFDKFSLQKKLYIYYLSRAALCGRDILWDQNNRYNLRVRAVLEQIYKTFAGNRACQDFERFVVFLKRVWFSNGIHHHYSTEKIEPGFSPDYFQTLVWQSDWNGFPLPDNAERERLFREISTILFSSEKEMKRVCLAPDKDVICSSANNFYRGLTQLEAEAYYAALKKGAGENPVSFGLNSRLEKNDGKIVEKVWKSGGLYGAAIDQIIFWLEKASEYAETEYQKQVIEKLVTYYRTGDLRLFDEYCIDWVKELDGEVDFINGFIEVYGDALGIKATWESIVNFKDHEASHRADVLSQNAWWFEQNSPVGDRFKKEDVRGVSARVIHVAILGGDCYPATPIGINLPNSEWIREIHGSKSVTIENITYSYFLDSLGNGMLEEFAFSEEEKARAREFGYLAGNLHTDLHECLGHGSGRMMDGITSEHLKNYYSTIEEARADLFALYYMMDEKLLDLGLLPSPDAALAEYDAYLRNGLMTQLTRIEPGKDLEESHMRNRQLICRWAYEHGKADGVVDFVSRDEKTYVRINDYQQLRNLFGQLLAEVQRIKSEGDFEAAQALVESYGVRVDRPLHNEILARFKKLDIAPYAGFINPEYELICDESGNPVDVRISYTDDYAGQMLKYSREYGFLPLVND